MAQVRLLQAATAGGNSDCQVGVDSSNFHTALEQMAVCTSDENQHRNAEMARLWREVGAVSHRLLLTTPDNSTETSWLQSVSAFSFSSSVKEVTEEEEEEVVDVTTDYPLEVVVPQALHSQIQLTAASLQADVRAIWDTQGNEERAQLIDKVRDLLRQYLTLDASATMEIFLHAQSDLLTTSEYAVEQILFDVVQPLFLDVVNYGDFLMEVETGTTLQVHNLVVEAMDGAVGSALEVAKIAHSFVWHRLSAQEAHVLLTHVMLARLLPARCIDKLIHVAYSFRRRSSSHDYDGITDQDLSSLLLNHAACMNQLRRSEDVDGSLRYVMTTLSATALHLSLKQPRNVGVALMDCGLSEAGHLFVSVATLKMHQERFVPIAVADQGSIYSTSSVAIYCDEYNQSWWPGEPSKLFYTNS